MCTGRHRFKYILSSSFVRDKIGDKPGVPHKEMNKSVVMNSYSGLRPCITAEDLIYNPRAPAHVYDNVEWKT